MKVFSFAVILTIGLACGSEFPCSDHRDCTSKDEFFFEPFGVTSALCQLGRCVSLRENQACTRVNDCGFHHSCVNGRCKLGGVGDPCRTDSVNCAVGYACDGSKNKCVRGVAGVQCYGLDECGFGHSCFLQFPLPKNRIERRGMCKVGGLGTDACRRDNQCIGRMICVPRTVTTVNSVFKQYRCGIPADYSSTPFPQGFGSCDTDQECRIYSSEELTCIKGRCQPLALGQPCVFDFIAGNRQCSTFTACVNGRCAYAKEGDRCWSQVGGMNTQCPPGFQCTAPRDQGVGKEGKCVPGIEGLKCFDGQDCASNLVCGTSGKCTRSAEGQLCRSDYYCPKGLVCNKFTAACARPEDVPAKGRFPEVARSISCNTTVDCPVLSSCKNGICLPKSLGWACTASPVYEGITCVNGLEVEGIQGSNCTFPSNCFIGHSCVNDKCTPTSPSAGCNRDYNCPPDMVCTGDFKCIRPKRGEQCRSTRQCPLGLRCVKTFDIGVFGLCV